VQFLLGTVVIELDKDKAQALLGLIRFNVAGPADSPASLLQEIAVGLEKQGVRAWQQADGVAQFYSYKRLPGL